MSKLKKTLPFIIPLGLLLSSITINLLYNYYYDTQNIDGMYQMSKKVEGPNKQIKRINFSLYIDIDSESFWGVLHIFTKSERIIPFSGKISKLMLHDYPDNAIQVEKVKIYPVSPDTLEELFTNPALPLLRSMLATDYKLVWHYVLVDKILCIYDETDTGLMCMKKII